MALILSILFLGLMASLSPATILVFVLVLGTARARVNGVGFLIGWAVSLTIVFATSYALGASEPVRSEDGRATVAVVEIVLGAALLVLAARMTLRTSSRRGEEAAPPSMGTTRLLGRMEDLTPAGAAVVGILKQPWAITTAAALVVAHNRASGLVAAVAFVLFTAASTATVALMFAYYARHPGQAQARLDELRDRAVSVGPAMGAVAAALVGVFLLVDGIVGLR